MKGRKPLPANVHLLRGNPSKIPDARLHGSVQPEVERPECPEHLSEVARVEWDRIVVELEKLGLVSQLDRAALAVYCQAWGRWVEAERHLAELGLEGLTMRTPTGFERPSAWLLVSERAVEQMHRFLTEFGMTPSARARVQRSPQLALFGEDAAGEYFS